MMWVPLQALRCVFGTDFARRQSQAAFAHDAQAGLAEFEEAAEVHEPRTQCVRCGGVDSPGHECGRPQQDSSPVASASTGDGGEAVSGPPRPPASPQPELVDLIIDVLGKHRHHMYDVGSHGCNCGQRFADYIFWRDHAAGLIAERIESARPAAPFTHGDLSAAADVIRAYVAKHQHAMDPRLADRLGALADRLASGANADSNP